MNDFTFHQNEGLKRKELIQSILVATNSALLQRLERKTSFSTAHRLIVDENWWPGQDFAVIVIPVTRL